MNEQQQERDIIQNWTIAVTAEKVARSSTRMAHTVTEKLCMLLEKHTCPKNTVKASWREKPVTMDEEKEVQCITPGSAGSSPQERQRKC